MLELEKLLWKKSKTYRTPTVQEKNAAQAFFEEWRDRFISVNAANIRNFIALNRNGALVQDYILLAQWSNAAIHLLTIPNETIQDWFLRSTWLEKHKIIQAVLRDGGIQNSHGTFIELPPL